MNVSKLLFFFTVLLTSLAGCRIRTTPPELTSLSKNPAYVGEEITLSGNQFGSAPVVLFGVATSMVTAKVVSNTDNSIVVKVPYITPGATQIRVQTDQGITDPLPLMVRQPIPQVGVISPTNGLTGTPVVITGDFLNQIRYIRFNEIDAPITDSTAQKITVLVPPNLPRGPVFFVIETKGGTYNSGFIVAGTPQITSLSPLKTKPGAQLSIKGVNLLDGVVRINGNFPDQSTTTITDTEIRTTIPVGATSGLVTVTVFDKLVATSTDTLQIFQQPVVARLSAQDAVAGEKVLIEGFNLKAITTVTFSTVSVPFRVISEMQLEATIPLLPATGAVTVSVSGIGGNASAGQPLFVFLAPSALVATPARQIRSGRITLTGKNLYRIKDVRFNGISVPIDAGVEGESLIVGVPEAGISGAVTVVNRAGLASTEAPFIVVQKAVVSSVLPASAQVGQRVIIKGDFLLNAKILFTGTNQVAVNDGKITDTERWVLVPKDAKTGPIRITNETNETTETAPFTVLP